MNQPYWRTVIYIMSIAVLFNIFYSYVAREAGQTAEISYSRFRAELAGNNLKKVSFKGVGVRGEFLRKIKVVETVQSKEVAREVGAFTTTMPAVADPALLGELTSRNVEISAVSSESSLLVTFLISMLPWVLIIGVWWYVSRNISKQMGPGGMLGSFAKSGAKMYSTGEKVNVTFDDVAGMENSKLELKEIVDYLKDPEWGVGSGLDLDTT